MNPWEGKMNGARVLVVLVTTPSFQEAVKIARSLVEEKLAACVNVVPKVTSIYRWQGKIEEEAEALMVVKTIPSAFEKLMARVKELHSYTVPEIIALPVVEGSGDYLDWVEESVAV